MPATARPNPSPQSVSACSRRSARQAGCKQHGEDAPSPPAVAASAGSRPIDARVRERAVGPGQGARERRPGPAAADRGDHGARRGLDGAPGLAWAPSRRRARTPGRARSAPAARPTAAPGSAPAAAGAGRGPGPGGRERDPDQAGGLREVPERGHGHHSAGGRGGARPAPGEHGQHARDRKRPRRRVHGEGGQRPDGGRRPRGPTRPRAGPGRARRRAGPVPAGPRRAASGDHPGAAATAGSAIAASSRSRSPAAVGRRPGSGCMARSSARERSCGSSGRTRCKRRRPLAEVLEQLGQAAGAERVSAGQRRVQRQAGRPHVRGAGGALARRLLGRHVGQRPQQRARRRSARGRPRRGRCRSRSGARCRPSTPGCSRA